jgi:hypothetical protein
MSAGFQPALMFAGILPAKAGGPYLPRCRRVRGGHQPHFPPFAPGFNVIDFFIVVVEQFS